MSQRFKAVVFVLFTSLTFVLAAGETKPVKYVFLFIGDGMSWPQIEAGDRFAKAIGRPGLFMKEISDFASTATRCANADVTDSAAAGTAIACGSKTNKYVLGLSPEGERLESIAEFAKRNGRRVGIVTSVTLNHATPAAFFGHRDSRERKYELGVDMLRSRFDFIGGGAIERPVPRVGEKIADGDRIGDLRDVAQSAGFRIVRGRAALSGLSSDSLPAIAIGAEQGELPFVIDKDEAARTFSLPELVAAAIRLLDNPDGFFLMTEGGRIDQAAHGNDLGSMLRETLEFDDCIRLAGEFLKRHPDETLIVVTGDHETGGLVLKDASKIGLAQRQALSAAAFSRDFEALKESNPAADADDMARLLKSGFGMSVAASEAEPADGVVLSGEEAARLELAFYRSVGNKEAEKGFFDSAEKAKAAYRDENPGFVYLAGLIFGEHCGAAWTTRGHTALPVKTMALGVGAEAIVAPNKAMPGGEEDRSRGIAVPPASIDNTDIANRLRPLLAPVEVAKP